MEPDGFIKPSIRFAGEIPIQCFGGSVLVKLEAADQSSRVGKFNHRKKSPIPLASL